MDLLVNLPNSELKDILEAKAKGNEEKYAELFTELSKITTHISRELRHINELFQEYTPHDKDYHISHLFGISDILLGTEKYRNMNLMELYLLVVAMYAHDWGMAVSKTERCYIATQNREEGSQEINLLQDEVNRFEQFINLKLGRISFNSDDEIDIELWQEYIRNTHALRSGIRVEKYFEHINGSIANALSKICIGHWLEIEEISDKRGYYRDTSVFGETVNLCALTIYIRLIDLFDLAEDRTPYVIWKYVNPKNKYSKMEWEKHRALHQVTCPSYESGRVVCISGSTDNHEVYAALLDLKFLCERYFRECSDVLAHMNDKRHELGVYFLDWRIEARNFKPISVQFNFERENIYRILSEEIYNCHPYVYIRELVQNSVDAITLRKEILNRKRVGGDNIGYIFIEANQTSDDDMEIICQDDGIGMDEYVLENYFSVLGKSYYRSNDFENTRVKMSPISKFGIGILSCFSIADQMEVITKREPYMGEGREGLKIVIGDIKRQFRVEELPEYKCEVGTRIKLKIKLADLYKYLTKNEMTIGDYSITSYLRLAAGFVKYPIIIRENDKKSVIIPQDYNIENLVRVIEDIDSYEIFTISDQYPINENVKVQDINKFNEIFDTIKFDLSKDLGIENAEGAISFAILKSFNDNIQNLKGMWPTDEISVSHEGEKFRIRWIDHNNMGNKELNWLQWKNINVYNKGFLLEGNGIAGTNWKFDLRSHLFPAPFININFTDTISEISVSRFVSKNELNILELIWEKLIDFVSEKLKSISEKFSGYEYWKQFVVIVLQYHISVSKLEKDIFNNINFPFINAQGSLIYKSIDGVSEIALIPNQKLNIIKEYCINQKIDIESKSWVYGECLLANESDTRIIANLSNQISVCIYSVLKKWFYLKKVIFINEPEVAFPVVQEIWERGEKINISSQIIEILSTFGFSVEKSEKDIDLIYKRYLDLDKFVDFGDDYVQYFSYGCKLLNLKHPIVHRLIAYYWLLVFIEENNMTSKNEVASMRDILDDLPFSKYNRSDQEYIKYYFADINGGLLKLHNWLSKFDETLPIDPIRISGTGFIPSSIVFVGEEFFSTIKDLEIRYSLGD